MYQVFYWSSGNLYNDWCGDRYTNKVCTKYNLNETPLAQIKEYRMKRYIIGLILIASTAYGQNKQYEEYKSNLKKYLEVTNTQQLLELSLDMIWEMMMEGDAYDLNEVPKSILDEFLEELKSESFNAYIKTGTPIFMKYLSNRDLINLINFYKTPTGKKFAKNSPKISQDMSVVMETWGEQIGKDFAKKLEERW
jgi:hypothetical protein